MEKKIPGPENQINIELTEEIAEKERLIAEDQLEEATKNPIAKEKKAKAGLSTGEAKAEEAKKSIDEDF